MEHHTMFELFELRTSSSEIVLDRPNIEEYLTESIHETSNHKLILRDLLDISPALTEAAGAIIDGFTYPVRTHFLDNFLEVTGYRLTIYNQIDDYGKEEKWRMQKQVFAFIDVEKLGSITFRQFLLGSAHIMKQPLFKQACIATFNGCDDKNKGYITKQQLGDAIHSAMPSMNGDNISELFNLFDSDNDDAIISDDFMACLRKNPLLVALFASNSMHCGLIEGGKLVIA